MLKTSHLWLSCDLHVHAVHTHTHAQYILTPTWSHSGRHVHWRHVFKDFIASNAAITPSDQTPVLRGDKVGKVSSFEHDREQRSLQSRRDAEDYTFPHRQHRDLAAPQDPGLLPKRKTSSCVNAPTCKETVSTSSAWPQVEWHLVWHVLWWQLPFPSPVCVCSPWSP